MRMWNLTPVDERGSRMLGLEDGRPLLRERKGSILKRSERGNDDELGKGSGDGGEGRVVVYG